MNQATRQRIDYLRWSLVRTGADTTCPACAATDTRVVDRKYLVTSLLECGNCRLRFRVPKEEPSTAGDFYQDAYHEGMTTEMPSDERLRVLLGKRFAGTEKDFRPYTQVCRAAGVPKYASLLDFGCSWGYGSWQLGQAGFDVYSSEISRPRREYARGKLGCRLVDDLGTLAGGIDCFFSAHVIEHLPQPNILFDYANLVLKPNGVVITFCPNGDPGSSWSEHYSDLWGRKHPLVITPDFIGRNAGQHGFIAKMYSNPYDLKAIEQGASGAELQGDELCVVMRRLAPC